MCTTGLPIPKLELTVICKKFGQCLHIVVIIILVGRENSQTACCRENIYFICLLVNIILERAVLFCTYLVMSVRL